MQPVRIESHTKSFDPMKTQATTVADNIVAKVELFKKGSGSWITANCQHIQDGDVHYYGVQKEHQSQSSSGQQLSIEDTRRLFQDLKLHILQNMQLPADTQVLQVVGESESFSLKGTAKVKEFLHQNIPANAVVLYGYTGISDPDGERSANAAVTDVVREKGITDKTIASVVFSTKRPAYLNKGPGELKHYVVVYDDATFGDNVTTSDFMADSLLILKGGMQSFRQACHALLLGKNITVWINEEFRHCYEAAPTPLPGIFTPLFAAGNFLKEVSDIVSASRLNNEECPVSALNKFYSGYFGCGKYYIVDRCLRDHDTMQKLMDDAWKFFMKEELYNNLHKLVSYH